MSLLQANQVSLVLFSVLLIECYKNVSLLRLLVDPLSECMPPTVVCYWDSMTFLSFFFYLRWMCVSVSILTTRLCWLHVSFPQASVRGQKGEKGEPAVLEPVSY